MILACFFPFLLWGHESDGRGGTIFTSTDGAGCWVLGAGGPSPLYRINIPSIYGRAVQSFGCIGLSRMLRRAKNIHRQDHD